MIRHGKKGMWKGGYGKEDMERMKELGGGGGGTNLAQNGLSFQFFIQLSI
jgi:hypothetical protein